MLMEMVLHSQNKNHYSLPRSLVSTLLKSKNGWYEYLDTWYGGRKWALSGKSERAVCCNTGQHQLRSHQAIIVVTNASNLASASAMVRTSINEAGFTTPYGRMTMACRGNLQPDNDSKLWWGVWIPHSNKVLTLSEVRERKIQKKNLLMIWLVWNLRPLAQKSNSLALEQQLNIIMTAILFWTNLKHNKSKS
jgi:hypothetical protein